MAVYLLPFVVFASLSVLYQTNTLKLSKQFYALALFALAIFAGLRFEVGQDWDAYEALFDRIDLSDNIIDLYSSGYQQFEIGYYGLSYIVKLLGGSYIVVFFLIASFLSYAFYKFTSRFTVNIFYILAIYVGNCFLLLNFAQVRQAIAIGFFLLGCDYYLRTRRRLTALAITLIGLVFQYTSIMYPLLLVLVLYWPERNKVLWVTIALFLFSTSLVVISQFLDFYSLVAILSASTSAAEKIEIYRETQSIQGLGQLVYSGYLLLLIFYLGKNARFVDPSRVFIIHYAIASLLLTVIFAIVFPGTYAFYSRIYVVAVIFQGYAAAIIFSSTKRLKLQNTVIFSVTLVSSAIYVFRLIDSYGDEYLPYKSVVSLLSF